MAASALGSLSSLWPPFDPYQIEIALCCGALGVLFIGLFADHQLRSIPSPLIRVLTISLRITGLIVFLAGLWMVLSWHAVAIRCMLAGAFLMSLLLVVTGASLWRAKVSYGLSYTVAWSCVAVGFALTLLLLQGLLQWDIAQRVPLMTGLILEVVLVSFVLAGSFSDAHAQMIAAHAEALRNMEHAQSLQHAAEQAQEVATDELERKVQERTFELEVTLRELEETNQRLEEQSTIDFLTGVRNRKHFDKRYVAEFRRSRREQTPLSVMMLDIDHFKTVNDTYGHLIGDECIRQVAQQIQAVVKRPSDIVTRYGGEEFAVILPATPIEGAAQVAEDVIAAVRATPLMTSDGRLSVTVSAGVSCSSIQPNISPEDLLDAADQALYQAKSAGRDQVKLQTVIVPPDLS